MNCPRCEHDRVDTLAESPVPGVWRVRQCARCRYSWRTSEPARRTTREQYPPEFMVTRADIEAAPQLPTVPPRTAEA